jgi:hypothetical protein
MQKARMHDFIDMAPKILKLQSTHYRHNPSAASARRIVHGSVFGCDYCIELRAVPPLHKSLTAHFCSTAL